MNLIGQEGEARPGRQEEEGKGKEEGKRTSTLCWRA